MPGQVIEELFAVCVEPTAFAGSEGDVGWEGLGQAVETALVGGTGFGREVDVGDGFVVLVARVGAGGYVFGV